MCRHCNAACPCREALEKHEQECAQEIEDQSVTSEDTSRLALLKLPKNCDPNSVIGRMILSMNEGRRRRFALKNTPVMLKLKRDYKRSLANQEAARKRELKLAEKRRSRAPRKRTLMLKRQQEDIAINAEADIKHSEKIR